MIHLIGNLYSVEVPSDHESKISILNWLCIRHKKERIWQVAFKLEGNFKILGEVSKDEISFDVKKLPEMSLTIKEANLLLNENDKIDFRSLLQSKGIHFVNNLNENQHTFAGLKSIQWQDFENKVIKGKLIILEKL